MTANNFLTSSELDYNALRASLKTFLASQDRFKDYDFEGSNMAILLDLLAYNTHLEAHYLNMVGSESFLDTTRLYDSAYSHAKELNYVPRSTSSARAVVTMTVNTGNTAPTSVTIPRYFTLTTNYTDTAGVKKAYKFNTLEPVTVTMNENGAYVSSNVEIREGRVVREVFVANNTSRYVLQSANVDTSSVRVVVQESNVNSSNVEFTLAENLYGLTTEDPVYFLQGAYDGRYEVQFGKGNVGKAVIPGNLVRITYLDSSGEVPNGANNFSPSSTFDGYTVSTVQTITRAYGGSPKETVESIKFNAPRHFSTQERAVTKSDFVNLVRSKFPQIQDVIAYGGEEVTPKQYGKVILSAKPYGDTILSDALKSEIINYVSGKNIVTEPIIVDAEYLYVDLKVSVSYDATSTTSSSSDIQDAVISDVVTFFNEELTGFGVDLKYSKLLRTIDDADPAITGNTITPVILKKLYPQEGTSNGIKFSFMNKLKVATRYSDPQNHDAIVQSTNFVYLYGGTLYDSAIQDDGDGVLFIYTKDGDNKVILNSDVGSVDYDTGEIILTLNPYSYDTVIEFRAIPESYDISVEANVFLSLDEESLQVTVTRD